jgi:integrase
MTVISLAGNRNKGKRNRIVPIPEFVKESLMLFRSENNLPQHNIFTGTDKPYNFTYFSTLWGRFKKKSTILEANQTMYSLRHSAAVQVFEKTGSLTKLQQVMGHSSLQVSLTYLRGLQVKQLLVEDMPGL